MMRSLLSNTLRRTHRSLRQGVVLRKNHQLPTAAITGDKEREALLSEWMFLASTAFLATAASKLLSTECEREGEDEEVEDPYENLPEEDEPTHCSICMTYRQGPCRPYWRKVEACTKDNELKKDDNEDKEDSISNDDDEPKQDDDKNKDPPCLKYMMPWIDCATGFRNLYSLIELDTNYTLGIQDLEKEATQTLCWAPGHDPQVDWSAWQQYVSDHKEWKLPKKKKTSSKNATKLSLWKTLDQTKDPELIQVEAKVSMKQGEGTLECAYALDQDDNVIGFSYGTKPSEAEASREDKNDEDTPSEVDLKIRLVPTRTRQVVIAASYTQPRKMDGKTEDPLEAHIYKSKPYSLKKMSKTP